MKTHGVLALAMATLSIPAAAQEESAGDNMIVDESNPLLEDNPLLKEWSTPFGVPPFSILKDEHYLPALRAAIAEHKGEVAAIAASKDAPTFANTIEALEASGRRMTRAARVFFTLESAHSNDALREVARVIAPELSAHGDDVFLDAELFARVKAVYDQRAELALGSEQQRLLEETNKGFVRAGVNLSAESQQRLRAINAELATLSEEFGQNLLAETNAFELHLTKPEELAGLPDALVAAAAQEATRRGHDSGWSFTLSRPSINPFLQYSPNRDLRKVLFDGYARRGDNDNDHDNKADLSRIVALRAERSALLGYPTHAHYVLSDNMAETPERVYELLDKVWKPALRVAKSERDVLQAMMREDGVEDELRGFDWRHYTEKVRKARFDYDEETTRPYFEVSAVREGVFILAQKLFGLSFTQRQDLPTWHPDQQVFEVKEGDRHVGILYLDFFTRESKRGGAWMASLQPQSRLGGEVAPIVTTNFNFPPPTARSPSLLSFREAQTLFHEVGHALHGLLSNVTYESLSGTSVPRDFVEFPSQLMENWMSEPEVLRLYAKHYETGEVIPDDLITKIKASVAYNQGFATLEYIAAAYLDLAWHTLEEPTIQDARAFEAAEMQRIGLIDEIVPRYRSTYFAHVFSGGYASGYYSYLWSEVLDADAFEAFKEKGLFDAETARRYRRLLSQGGTKPGMVLYEEFRGRAPVIEPLLERRGLSEEVRASTETEPAP